MHDIMRIRGIDTATDGRGCCSDEVFGIYSPSVWTTGQVDWSRVEFWAHIGAEALFEFWVRDTAEDRDAKTGWLCWDIEITALAAKRRRYRLPNKNSEVEHERRGTIDGWRRTYDMWMTGGWRATLNANNVEFRPSPGVWGGQLLPRLGPW